MEFQGREGKDYRHSPSRPWNSMFCPVGGCYGYARRHLRKRIDYNHSYCPPPAHTSWISGIKNNSREDIGFFYGTAPYKDSKTIKYLNEDLLQGKVVFKRGCAIVYYRDIQPFYT